jgi:hypothetical protein
MAIIHGRSDRLEGFAKVPARVVAATYVLLGLRGDSSRLGPRRPKGSAASPAADCCSRARRGRRGDPRL